MGRVAAVSSSKQQAAPNLRGREQLQRGEVVAVLVPTLELQLLLLRATLGLRVGLRVDRVRATLGLGVGLRGDRVRAPPPA